MFSNELVEIIIIIGAPYVLFAVLLFIWATLTRRFNILSRPPTLFFFALAVLSNFADFAITKVILDALGPNAVEGNTLVRLTTQSFVFFFAYKVVFFSVILGVILYYLRHVKWFVASAGLSASSFFLLLTASNILQTIAV